MYEVEYDATLKLVFKLQFVFDSRPSTNNKLDGISSGDINYKKFK